jgi:tetratricopeptide (TPR) repeat protein
MEKLSASTPEDLEAACFHALALLATVPRGSYDLAVRQRASSIAASVLAKNPKHPGATHLMIHANDDREHAHLALDAARAYARMAPATSHALHMPAHIFLQLGLWKEAVLSDEASFTASELRVRRRKLSIVQRDYHSLSWLAYEYLQRGQFQNARRAWVPIEDAIKIAEKSGSRVGWPSSEEHAHGDPAPADAAVLRSEFATMRAIHVVETGQWELMKGQSSFENVDELLAIGMSAAGLGDADRAASVHRLFEKFAREAKDPDDRALVTIYEAQAAAAAARSGKSVQAALKEAARAASIERTLPRPLGRPRPIKPSHELYGELLLETDRPREAMGEFEHALYRAANRARSLIGLARAQADAGDRASARKTYARFLEMWANADEGLPEIAEARKALGLKP